MTMPMNAMERGITVDTAAFPLVFHALFPNYSDDDVTAMLDTYDRLLSGMRRYAIVIYFHPNAPLMKAGNRGRVAQWWIQRRDRVREMNVASVVVLPSAVIRGALTAVQWLVQPTNPAVPAASVGEGIDLCVARLNESGILVGDRSLAWLRAKYSSLPRP